MELLPSFRVSLKHDSQIEDGPKVEALCKIQVLKAYETYFLCLGIVVRMLLKMELRSSFWVYCGAIRFNRTSSMWYRSNFPYNDIGNYV